MKKALQNNLIRTYTILTATLFGVEYIFRILNHMSLFSIAVLRVLIVLSTITFPIAYLVCKVKEKFQKVWILAISFVLTFFIMIQLGCYNFLGNYVTISILQELGNTEGFAMEFIRNFDLFYLFELIPFGLLIIYYIFVDHRIKKRVDSKLNLSQAALILIGINGLLYLSVSINMLQNKYQVVSNLSLFRNPSVQNLSVNQFGLLGYELLDVKSIVLPSKVEEEVVPAVETSKEEPEVPVEPMYDRVIDDTMWKLLIEEETNTTKNSLNNYYISKAVTDKNEKTGIFKDKNVIMIMVESGNDAIVSYPEFFPNLYKIYSEGWAWTNNYSSKNQCATINNEFGTISSLFTISNSCTASSYKENIYPEALFNIFKNSGYYVSSYHDYMDYYYNRKVIQKNLGNSNYNNARDLGISVPAPRVWPSDVELIDKSFDKYINEEKFFTFYTTVTMHLPYSESSTYGDKYFDLFADLDISRNSKRYMSKVKEFDNAMGELLTKLEASGKMDDTVIILFCDHYPYGLTNSAISSIVNYDASENKERERTPFIIYSNTLSAEKYEDYTTLVNVTPTVANLFDLDYDPRLYSGYDLFSDTYDGRAVFHDGSWQDENAFYNATNGELVSLNSNYSYTDEEMYNINLEVTNRIKMANLAIKNNYFYYRQTELDKLVQENKEREYENEASDSGISE